MELKNALAVCLVSLFSATLVVLVARSLDNQAASRLEPQLERIANELEMIRSQGGLAVGGQATAETDGVVMYYFHGKVRCPTCRAIESQSHDVLTKKFAGPLQRREIVWEVVDSEADANADLAERFAVQVAVVVLARFEQGEMVDWKRLDQVWALWDDEPAFAAFMQREIQAMLDGSAVAKAADEDMGDEDGVTEDGVTEDGEEEESDLGSLPLPGDGS